MLVNFLEFSVYTLCVADKLPMRMSAGQQCSRAWHGRAGQPHSISIFHSIFIFPAQLKAKKTFQWLQPSYLTAGSGLCGAFCCHSCVCKCAWVCVRCVCVFSVSVLPVNSFRLQLYAATCRGGSGRGHSAAVVCILQHCR